MAAKLLPGYFSSLTAVWESDDTSIPLKEIHVLLSRLNVGEWTTVLVQDTVGFEVVKVINHQGTIAVERGLSGTPARRFPVGACVSFVPSDELVKAMICETDCCETGVDKTYGAVADAPSNFELETLPTHVVGGLNALLGEPAGFMKVNGKKVPYYE